jgi:hypothetical protein
VKKLLKENFSNIEQLIENLQLSTRLHADNLFKAGDAEGFFNQLVSNTIKSATKLEEDFKRAATGNQPEIVARYLCMLGIATHALQDFCSHSTWVSKFPAIELSGDGTKRYHLAIPLDRKSRGNLQSTQSGWYEYLTKWNGWYEIEESIDDKLVVHDKVEHDVLEKLRELKITDEKRDQIANATSVHLDYQSRKYKLNGVDRETTWDESYLTGYMLCEAFIALMMGKAPKMSEKAKEYATANGKSQELTESLYKMKYAFMWFQKGNKDTNGNPHHNGHYKGPGSGDTASLVFGGLYPVALDAIPLVGFFLASNIAGVAYVLATISNTLKESKDFLELTKDLAKDLYRKNQATVDLGINYAMPEIRVFSIAIHSFKTTRPKSPLEWINAGSRPDPYVRATIRWIEDGKPLSMVYNERVFQDIPPKPNAINFEFVVDKDTPSANKSDPWTILHPIKKDVQNLDVYLQVFDEDFFLNGADDEYKITDKGQKTLGYTISVDLDNKTITRNGKSSEGILKDVEPENFICEGATDSVLFAPTPATIVFSVEVADVSTSNN